MQRWALALVLLEIFFGYKRNGFRSHFYRFERKFAYIFPVSHEKRKWTAHPSCSRCTDNKKMVRHFRIKMKNTTISALSWPSNFNYRLTTLINKFFRWPLEWKCDLYHQFPGFALFALSAFILSSVFPVSGLSVCLVRFPAGFLIAVVSILLTFSF